MALQLAVAHVVDCEFCPLVRCPFEGRFHGVEDCQREIREYWMRRAEEEAGLGGSHVNNRKNV
jgi:hypothetical protein